MPFRPIKLCKFGSLICIKNGPIRTQGRLVLCKWASPFNLLKRLRFSALWTVYLYKRSPSTAPQTGDSCWHWMGGTELLSTVPGSGIDGSRGAAVSHSLRTLRAVFRSHLPGSGRPCRHWLLPACLIVAVLAVRSGLIGTSCFIEKQLWGCRTPLPPGPGGVCLLATPGTVFGFTELGKPR